MPAGNSDDNLLDAALTLHRAGDLAGAQAAYQRILEGNPGNAEAMHLLGLVRHQTGDHGGAEALIADAIAHLPGVAAFHANLGLVRMAAGRPADAEAVFRSALAISPDDPGVMASLAAALRAQGKLADAAKVLETAMALAPGFTGAAYNLANIRLAEGRVAAAVPLYRQALAAEPENRDIRLNLAAALQATGKPDEAAGILKSVVDRTPSDAAALNNLGNALRQSGERAGALDALSRAVTAAPKLADAHYNLGALLADLNDIEKAAGHFQTARKLAPGLVKATWAEALTLPQIYGSTQQIADCRARYLAGLDRIADAARSAPDSALPDLLGAVTEHTPFALAYQGGNDLEPMTRYGGMIAGIAARAFPDLAEPPARTAGERVRVGFVSAHFRGHTVGRLFSGWVTGLDPARFEVHAISTAGSGDAETRALAARVHKAHLVPIGPAELVRLIAGLRLDVLIYPDIGMDPVTQLAAALPLAPLQLASWGHPVTTGLPHVRGFLSASAMEPEGADAHYRERLIRLPGLSIDYPRPDIPPLPRPENPAPVLFCAQSLFKAPPAQDATFARILAEVPDATLRFIAHPIGEVTAAFRQRLTGALSAMGVDPARIEFLPPTDRAGFVGYCRGADVILDTFGWSGGNTSLEAFHAGTSVVTLPGAFMRGRHTSAMLTLMELPELVAADADGYAGIAVRLATDGDFSGDMRNRIAERAPALFGDKTPVRALEDTIEDLIRR